MWPELILGSTRDQFCINKQQISTFFALLSLKVFNKLRNLMDKRKLNTLVETVSKVRQETNAELMKIKTRSIGKRN